MTQRLGARVQTRLLVLVVVALLPAVVLVVAMGVMQYRQAEDEIRREIGHLARIGGFGLERSIEHSHALLASLSSARDLQSDAAACGVRLARALDRNPEYLNVAIVSADGAVPCSGMPVASDAARAERRFLERVRDRSGFAIGGYRRDGLADRPHLLFGQPLAERSDAMLAAALDVRSLVELASRADLPHGAVTLVVDARGTVLARHPSDGAIEGRRETASPLVRHLLSVSDAGFVETEGVDGIRRLFAYSPLSVDHGERFVTVVGVLPDAAWDVVRDRLVVAAAGLAGASLLIVLTAWKLGDLLIVNRLRGLLQAARRFGAGDATARTGLTRDGSELGELGCAFDEMAASLERRLRELDLHREVLDHHAIVSIADRAGRITYVNDRFLEASQYTREELIGSDHRILNSGLQTPGFYATLWRTITAGKVWRGTVRNRRKDGTFYWERSTIVPFPGQDGSPCRYVSVRTDITEVKTAEQRLIAAGTELEHRVAERTAELALAKAQLEIDIAEREHAQAELQANYAALEETNRRLRDAQTQLLQSEKMASIGQLAAGVAHEINNPIGYVCSNLNSLEKYLGDLLAVVAAHEAAAPLLPPRAREEVAAASTRADLDYLRDDVFALMRESFEGIGRVKKIVQDLKDFSHAGVEDEWQWVDLHTGLDSTLNIVWNELKYKADVRREYGEVPEVHCLPSQLNQVFMNILMNAAQAIEEHGVITLRTGVDGGDAWIEIGDTGKGIDPEHLPRIFDPFFTTKPVGEGTGLGLSLSYGIVKKHGGGIDVRSEPGTGTTFRIRVPVQGPAPEASGVGGEG